VPHKTFSMRFPLAATAALNLLVTTLHISSVEAGGCPPTRLGVKVKYCGRVENNSTLTTSHCHGTNDADSGSLAPWTLKWSEYGSDLPDLCHVYNWNGGDGAVSRPTCPHSSRPSNLITHQHSCRSAGHQKKASASHVSSTLLRQAKTKAAMMNASTSTV